MKIFNAAFLLVLFFSAGCATQEEPAANAERAVVADAVEQFSGSYIGNKDRIIALIPSRSGQDRWATGRQVILHKGEPLYVVSISGKRAHVKLADNRYAYMYIHDLAPEIASEAPSHTTPSANRTEPESEVPVTTAKTKTHRSTKAPAKKKPQPDAPVILKKFPEIVDLEITGQPNPVEPPARAVTTTRVQPTATPAPKKTVPEPKPTDPPTINISPFVAPADDTIAEGQ